MAGRIPVLRSVQEPERADAPVRCAACPIRDRAVCSLCEPAELAMLDAIKSYREYPSGAEIVGAGEQFEFVASIVTGVVKLTKTLADGRTQMVGLLFPGDFLGRSRPGPAEFDADAATPVLLCCFTRRPFLRILHDTPHLEQRLLEMTMDELEGAREWMLLLGRKTAREKVATFIQMLWRRTGHTVVEEEEIPLPLTRAEIAEYLGLTIETVSRQMTKLRGERIVDFSSARSLRVTDDEALEAAAGY